MSGGVGGASHVLERETADWRDFDTDGRKLWLKSK